jgi:hypothetical protein
MYSKESNLAGSTRARESIGGASPRDAMDRHRAEVEV